MVNRLITPFPYSNARNFCQGPARKAWGCRVIFHVMREEMCFLTQRDVWRVVSTNRKPNLSQIIDYGSIQGTESMGCLLHPILPDIQAARAQNERSGSQLKMQKHSATRWNWDIPPKDKRPNPASLSPFFLITIPLPLKPDHSSALGRIHGSVRVKTTKVNGKQESLPSWHNFKSAAKNALMPLLLQQRK